VVVDIHIYTHVVIVTARAVSCYECDSVNDSKCGVDFEPDDIAKTDCDSMELPENLRAIYLQRPETACLTKFYRGSLPDEALFVRRSCAFFDFLDCDETPDPVKPYLSFMGCSFCHTDLCNASPGMSLSKSFLVTTVLLALVA
ncbi:hypothetical protein KR222_008294, partial [Zaprionus bogoriensis]